MRQLIASLFLIVLFSSCGNNSPRLAVPANEVASLWAEMTLYITKNTPANSPTFASRAFAYTSVTMYESVVHGSPKNHSLAGQLNELDKLPLPEKGKQYNWVLAMNAGQAEILRSIYIQTSQENKLKIDSLEKLVFNSFKGTKEVDERSVAFGKTIAAAIFDWSKTDGGHRGYLANFDNGVVYPTGKGSWKPPFFAQTISRLPLHPHWGNNRTFLKADTNWKMPAFIPHDPANVSDCYRQFRDVYLANKNITQEQKEIALWWNDDPAETFTPPGHSFNLAKIVAQTQKPDLFKAAETYARVGLAVADAFIVCWRMKYKFFSERPSTFVNEHIDDAWDPFWPDPPFPAFPSGHATQASAVAVVLADLYGDKMNITDDTHAGRSRDELKDVDYKPRKFNSFWQVAEETAYSRFLGGIHTKQDNAIGLQEGSKVGHNVNALQWYN